jgi:pimeloyl-ACP methyl ester carboxylesterase
MRAGADILRSMIRGRRNGSRTWERSGRPRRLGPVVKGLLLAGAVVGVPALASSVIRRRAESPQPLRWGRSHRYAGRSGEVVFQELGPRQGNRPPLVLLHSCGPGHDADQWRAAAEALADRFHIYVLDLPGWGRSPAGRGRLDASGYVEVITDFLTGVLQEPAVLVAAGLSAAYAVKIAAEHPGLVRALALVSPFGLSAADGAVLPSGPGLAFLRRLLALPVLKDTVLDLLTSRSAIGQHLRKEVYAAPERVDAALLDRHYRASHVPQARAALAACLGGGLGLSIADDLPEIGVPVWLAWGRKSSSPKVESAELWTERLPQGAQLEVFEGSGAQPHAEASALFAKGLERFLSGIG